MKFTHVVESMIPVGNDLMVRLLYQPEHFVYARNPHFDEIVAALTESCRTRGKVTLDIEGPEIVGVVKGEPR